MGLRGTAQFRYGRGMRLAWLWLGVACVACAHEAPNKTSTGTTATEALPTIGPAPSESTPVDEPEADGGASSAGPTPVGSPEPVQPEASPVEAVACKTEKDCWVDDDGKPIPRPKNKRGVVLKPCKKGGHKTPACEENVCVVKVWKC